MHKFSAVSLRRLGECDHRLQKVMTLALERSPIDFGVVCGHRGETEQNACVARGTSKVRFPNSKHNKMPSLAVDIAPWNAAKRDFDWSNTVAYRQLADVVKACAKELGIDIIWGGDWKSFVDMPHFEVAPEVKQQPKPETPKSETTKIPQSLIDAIIQVESGGNTYAMRYEQGFFQRYVASTPTSTRMSIAPCSEETERKARATSWGLMQVMGETARSCGFVGPFLSELCNPEVGIRFGVKYLEKLAKKFDYYWPSVCAAYNGGPGAVKGKDSYSNPEYPAKVLKALGGEWPA